MKLKTVTQEQIHKKYLKGFDIKSFPSRLGYVISLKGTDKKAYIDPFNCPEFFYEGLKKYKLKKVYSNEFEQYVTIKKEIKQKKAITQQQYNRALNNYINSLKYLKSQLKTYAKTNKRKTPRSTQKKRRSNGHKKSL